MDITEGSQQRIEIGVSHLIEGGLLSYNDVDFHIDRRKTPVELLVSSYSESYYPENVAKAEAREKIERSKIIGEDLANRSPEFKIIWESTAKRYEFCFDYGKLSFTLAEESGDKLAWKDK